MKKINKKYINPKTGKKYEYYDRRGNGIENVFEWARLIEPRFYKSEEAWRSYKIVKQEYTWLGFYVSTVYLGLDHSFSEHEPPLIFETMVFGKGGWDDLDMNRYTTIVQAQRGHEEMVKKWSNPFLVGLKWVDRITWGLRWKIRKIFYART